MTHDEAEKLRSDPAHWRWGIIYSCRKDPRIIVRNTWMFGWTWNLAHPRTFAAIALVLLCAAGLPYWALATGKPGWLVAGLFGVVVLATVAVAHYVANGPR